MEKCKILFCLFLCVIEIQATEFCLNVDFVAENDILFAIYMYSIFSIFPSPVLWLTCPGQTYFYMAT